MPMTRAPRAAIVVALLVLIGMPFAKADDTAALGTPITDPAEITRHMAGNTLSGVLKETGEAWTEFYCDTGRSLYEFGGINLGKWWTEGSKVCFAYEYNDYQLPRCFDMFGKPDGSLSFRAIDDSG